MNKWVIETPADMQELMKECIRVTHDYIKLCNKKFNICMSLLPVEFNLRGTTAGKALIRKAKIQYNPTLLRENPETFLERTCGHEVVHHAAYCKHGFSISGHGIEWQSMMRAMSLPPSRCHSYDTSNVPSKVGKVRKSLGSRVISINDTTITNFGIGKLITFD